MNPNVLGLVDAFEKATQLRRNAARGLAPLYPPAAATRDAAVGGIYSPAGGAPVASAGGSTSSAVAGNAPEPRSTGLGSQAALDNLPGPVVPGAGAPAETTRVQPRAVEPRLVFPSERMRWGRRLPRRLRGRVGRHGRCRDRPRHLRCHRRPCLRRCVVSVHPAEKGAPAVVVPATTTQLAVDAIAWGRAPAYSPKGRPNLRVLCADGFSVSVQASSWHYASDSGSDSSGPYWRGLDTEPVYPFVSFEVGFPTSEPPDTWSDFEGGGIWARVPRGLVEALLDAHGGAVGWTRDESGEPEQTSLGATS